MKRTANAFSLLALLVVVPSAQCMAQTVWAGWYVRWGQEGSCQGGGAPGYDPDMWDVWVVDDQGNEYYSGETSHNVCNSHSGTFYDNYYYRSCNAQSSGCPMIDGPVQPHKHHENCDH